ncbi:MULTISPECIES: pro-sigmaK processing inhibitor BofA family protein [Gracilibacillus]|uniref:Pro-sigmaK processing inhibitor BofA n=1 Tax=Gracilibacillus dipsosauri TaxID=178340 RepID=A0A317L3P9_9BACI|nr:pro-sigmaK processing inhibitor BofA family protein [Gracilibacillus dipsosauri]PWU70113.1 pro-sigmaK processing inhibitor BofA [Gracilibacillus dipsosauri]
MNIWVIAGLLILIVLLLTKGIPLKFSRVLGQGVVKVTIGVLFLFFFNLFGASLGLHIPINIFTAVVAGLLGVPGIASLTAIHIFILP